MKETDFEKLKSDFETLISDCKQIFGNFKETLQEEVASKIPSSKKIKEKIADQAKSNWFGYLIGAFIIGTVVGAFMRPNEGAKSYIKKEKK